MLLEEGIWCLGDRAREKNGKLLKNGTIRSFFNKLETVKKIRAK